MRFVILVDDDDRDEAPDRPWTANLFENWDGEAGDMLNGEAGLGATPEEALTDLFRDPALDQFRVSVPNFADDGFEPDEDPFDPGHDDWRAATDDEAVAYHSGHWPTGLACREDDAGNVEVRPAGKA